MIKKSYECDICKAQSPSIFEIEVKIERLLMMNGDGKPTKTPQKSFIVQVCGASCAMAAMLEPINKIFGQKEAKETNDKANG